MKITPKNMTLYRHLFVISTVLERNCWVVEDVERKKKKTMTGTWGRRIKARNRWSILTCSILCDINNLIITILGIEWEIFEILLNLVSKLMKCVINLIFWARESINIKIVNLLINFKCLAPCFEHTNIFN